MVVELAPSPLYKNVKLFPCHSFLSCLHINLKVFGDTNILQQMWNFAFGCCPLKTPLGAEECYVYDTLNPKWVSQPSRVNGSRKYTTTFHKSRRCEFWSNEYYMCLCRVNRIYTTSILTLGLRSRIYKVHTTCAKSRIMIWLEKYVLGMLCML